MIFDGQKLGQVGSWVCLIFRLGQKLEQDLWLEVRAARSLGWCSIFRPGFANTFRRMGELNVLFDLVLIL